MIDAAIACLVLIIAAATVAGITLRGSAPPPPPQESLKQPADAILSYALSSAPSGVQAAAYSNDTRALAAAFARLCPYPFRISAYVEQPSGQPALVWSYQTAGFAEASTKGAYASDLMPVPPPGTQALMYLSLTLAPP